MADNASRTAVRDHRAYPYGSAAFTALVEESYREGGGRSAQEFYAWFQRAYDAGTQRYPGLEHLPLTELLPALRERRARCNSPAAATAHELQAGAWLHQLIKSAIPRFSLERGFEFRNAVSLGERQCLLQSVLIAGLLQAAGSDAGTVMVYRNHAGVSTNLGHVAALLLLPDGTHRVVDASEKTPFPQQTGLFLCLEDGHAFLEPVYQSNLSAITGYRRTGTGVGVDLGRVRPLSRDYLHSQFYYYRGERAEGGILGAPPTPTGLKRSAAHLRKSLAWCPGNPLATYQLGRVLLRQGEPAPALLLLEKAHGLYQRAGWVPPGPQNALLEARRRRKVRHASVSAPLRAP